MRCVTLARVSSVIGAVAGLALASWAAAAQDMKDAAPAAATSQEAPELRPGEIRIRKTGKTRRVAIVTRSAEAVSRAPAEAARPNRGPAADDRPDEPAPRSVTIGYTLREPLEQGWGPQVYEPASPYMPNNPYGWNYYGCNTYLPSYGYGGVGFGGSGGGCRTYGGGLGYGGGFGYRPYGSFGGRGSFAGRQSFVTPRAAPMTLGRRAK
jgi:hypothetical protein